MYTHFVSPFTFVIVPRCVFFILSVSIGKISKNNSNRKKIGDITINTIDEQNALENVYLFLRKRTSLYWSLLQMYLKSEIARRL